jgi:hypothetical protein
MNPNPATLLPLWHRALASEIGIAIRTNDRRWLQTALYEARSRANDPQLEKIMLVMPGKDLEGNPSQEVMMLKKQVELES